MKPRQTRWKEGGFMPQPALPATALSRLDGRNPRRHILSRCELGASETTSLGLLLTAGSEPSSRVRQLLCCVGVVGDHALHPGFGAADGGSRPGQRPAAAKRAARQPLVWCRHRGWLCHRAGVLGTDRCIRPHRAGDRQSGRLQRAPRGRCGLPGRARAEHVAPRATSRVSAWAWRPTCSIPRLRSSSSASCRSSSRPAATCSP
jgi:hypothetical protein